MGGGVQVLAGPVVELLRAVPVPRGGLLGGPPHPSRGRAVQFDLRAGLAEEADGLPVVDLLADGPRRLDERDRLPERVLGTREVPAGAPVVLVVPVSDSGLPVLYPVVPRHDGVGVPVEDTRPLLEVGYPVLGTVGHDAGGLVVVVEPEDVADLVFERLRREFVGVAVDDPDPRRLGGLPPGDGGTARVPVAVVVVPALDYLRDEDDLHVGVGGVRSEPERDRVPGEVRAFSSQ